MLGTVFRKLQAGFALLLAMTWTGQAFAPSPARKQAVDVNERIEALIGQMALEEKAGQLAQYSFRTLTDPAVTRGDYKQMIARGEIGSLFNVSEAAQSNS